MIEALVLITLISLSLIAFIGCSLRGEYLGMILGFIMFLILLISGCCGVFNEEPTALDVYQGKTTLKITYIDGVPVDSVVIYKERE